MSRKLPTHAKMSQTLVHASLFRSLKKGERKKQKLDVTYVSGDTTFKFTCFEPLDGTDLAVLQGLVALATGTLHRPSSGGIKLLLRDGRSERPGLNLNGDALEQRTIAVRFNLSDLAQLVGYADVGGSQRRTLRESISRLSNVSVSAKHPGFDATYHLLGGYGLDTKTGEVLVGLNPSVTAAVLGKTGFLRIDIAEIRQLKSEAARLLHSRLHWINQGDSRVIGIDKLCGYVYADTPATAGTERKRKHDVRKALLELLPLKWGVNEVSPGAYRICRPPARFSGGV